MDAPELPSRITAVTVFTSGALVTREADLASLATRPERIRLSGLPLCLDEASVRVRISGGLAVAADAAIVAEPATPDSSLPPQEDPALIAARGEVARIAAETQVLGAAIQRLTELAIADRPRGPRGSPPPPTPYAARLALVSFRRSEAQRLLAERDRLREQGHLAERRLAELAAAATAASTARRTREHELRCSLVIALRWTGAAAAAATLSVDYLVPGARWVPQYAIRFAPGLASATIALRGSVAQCTGEDWSDARVTVSSARALAWHDLPELGSLRIGRRQSAPPAVGWRAPAQGAEALYAEFDAAVARLEPALPHRSVVAEMSDDRAVAVGAAESFGGQPTPQQPAAPEPPAAMRSIRAMRSVATEESLKPMSFAKSLDEPEASKPHAMSKKKSRAEPDSYRGRGIERELDLDETGAGAHAAPDHPAAALLAYRRLRMLGPTHAERGRLVPQLQLSDDVALARHLANSVGQLALPTRTQLPAVAQFAYAYPAVAGARIPSDGTWHGVTLAERPVQTALTHVVVPRESREVFRVVALDNPFAVPLLAGPAEIHVGEDYLMTVGIEQTVVGGRVELGLGVEQAITVARNTAFEETSAGLLGGSLGLAHAIEIVLANKAQTAMGIEVRERLPTPALGAEDCKVRLGAITPPWEEYIQQQPHLEGGRRWRLTLAPGATTTLTANYVITIPAKAEIAGGNRREA